MKIAVISDIHGNLEALQSALERIDSLGITSVYCLGDIVGYGASPNECVELIRRRNIPSIAGNHDKAVIGEISIDDFSIMAREAVLWTRTVLTEENTAFLRGLGYQTEAHGVLFVHSAPDAPEEFRYLLSYGHAVESFRSLTANVCFIGHTHRPVIFCEDGNTQTLTPEKKFIVNVGSVGQPRDGDRRGCFAVFDTDQYMLEYVRMEYNIEESMKKITNAGLPQKLADRLLVGL